MAKPKKTQENKRQRAKSLTAGQIMELIILWPDRGIEELVEHFGVSKPTIEKIAREVRRQNPEECKKKGNDLSKRVAQALKQLVAEKNQLGDQRILPSVDSHDQDVHLN